MSSVESLFTPFQCKSLKLKNRFVMAPMQRSKAADGIYPDYMVDYYERRAKADVGLIITEATGIERDAARNEPFAPLFHGEKPLAVWKDLIARVHAGGAKVCPQFWHVGAWPVPDWAKPYQITYESPSGLGGADEPMGVVMTDEDIADTIAAFGPMTSAWMPCSFTARMAI